MNNIPSFEAIDSRNIKPFALSSGVAATSILIGTSAILKSKKIFSFFPAGDSCLYLSVSLQHGRKKTTNKKITLA
jgi:hypothetical protein